MTEHIASVAMLYEDYRLQGIQAFHAGLRLTDCPYMLQPGELADRRCMAWSIGWLQERLEAKHIEGDW